MTEPAPTETLITLYSRGGFEIYAECVTISTTEDAAVLHVLGPGWPKSVRFDVEPATYFPLRQALYRKAIETVNIQMARHAQDPQQIAAHRAALKALREAQAQLTTSQEKQMATTSTMHGKKTSKKKRSKKDTKKDTPLDTPETSSEAEAADDLAKSEEPARRRAPKQSQGDLIDVDDPEDKELIELAKETLDHRQQFQAWNRSYSDRKKRLIALMGERGKTHYRHGKVIIDITNPDPGLKVRIEDDEE